MTDAPDRGKYASYIEGWKRRYAERAQARLRRAAEARAAAERCARMLAEKYGARRVWLYGSTLTPEHFDERSDIDLAAEGLGSAWLRAGIDCEPLAPGIEVSLLPIEMAHDLMRKTIFEEGVLLHDASA